MDKMQRLCLIGAGSWATALASLLLHNGLHLDWVVRRKADADYLNAEGRNPRYLTGTKMPTAHLNAVLDARQAVAENDVILIVAPAKHLSDTLSSLDSEAFKSKRVVTAIKGLEAQSGKVVHQYLRESYGVAPANYGAILGPGHAEELSVGQMTYLTAVSKNKALIEDLKHWLSCDYVRVSESDDILGAEFASVLKNVYAIACGMADGLVYGDNFQSILVSAAAREMNTLLEKHAPAERNIGEANYLGDLLVTAFSRHSRNRRLGFQVGSGSAPEDSGMVAEGFHSVRQLVDVQGFSAPILNAMYAILHQEKPARETMRQLEPELR